MTHASAIEHVRDALRGQEITSDLVGRPVPAFAVVSREALATLVDGDWVVRPLGVIEANEKRERAGNGDGTSGTSDSSTEENGAELAPAPTPCAECGTPLESFELARQAEAKGTKFAGLCNDCVYLKLGIR